jgi:hypothetical protein
VSVTDKIFHFSQFPCERWPSTLQTSYNPLLDFSLPTRGESCTVEGRGPKSVDFLMVRSQTLTSTRKALFLFSSPDPIWEFDRIRSSCLTSASRRVVTTPVGRLDSRLLVGLAKRADWAQKSPILLDYTSIVVFLFCCWREAINKVKAEKRKSTRFSVLTRKRTQTNFWECFGTEKKIS